MWYVGMKVVCVAEGWAPGCEIFHSHMPVKDQVYTIRELYWDDFFDVQAVRLEESIGRLIRTTVNGPMSERGFLAHYFEPVVESKGMETLFNILKTPHKVKEDA